MANLISRASGNLTDAATWGVADTTSAQTSITNWNSPWQDGTRISQSFTPGAITIDGVCLYAQPGSGAGTLTMTLYNLTDAANVVAVTVTAASINDDYGVVCFAFTAVTLIAGKAYQIRITCTNNGCVNLGTNNTDQNFWRLLRTTTTQAPVNNDVLFIQRDWTGSAAGTDRTVTMDNTADLTIGTANNTTALELSKGGSLLYGYAASTNYTLKILSWITSRVGSTFTIGDATNPIPATSTAKLIFMQTVDVQGGFNALGGTFTTYGASKTLWTKLTSNAAASQAVINVANVTGWANGDNVVVSPHRAVAADWDDKVIQSISTLAVTLTTNLGVLHEGSGIPVVDACYVMNLTCNVQVYSNNASYLWKIMAGSSPKYYHRYTRFSNLGRDAWWGGFQITRMNGTMLATLDIQYCVFSDCKTCSYIDLGSSTGFPATYKFNSNVCYRIEESVCRHAGINGAPHGDFVYEVKNNVVGRNTYHNASTFSLAFCKGDISGNVVLAYQDYQTAFYFYGAYTNQTELFTFADNICFGINNYAVQFGSGPVSTQEWKITRLKSVRAGSGSYFANVASGVAGTFNFIDCEDRAGQFVFYGAADARLAALQVNGGIYAGESATYPLSSTIFFYSAQFPHRLVCRNVDFTAGVGIVEFFSNSYVPWLYGQIQFLDCKIAAARIDDTALAAMVVRMFPTATQDDYPVISFHNANQVADDHRWVTPYCGFGKRDDTVFNTAAPSEKLYPKSASYKMRSAVKRFAVAAGATKTVSVWVRKNTGYNGAVAPRLVAVANSGLGYKTGTTLATLTAGVDTWGLLSYTLPTSFFKTVAEFYIECEGTAGSVNVDDWSIF